MRKPNGNRPKKKSPKRASPRSSYHETGIKYEEMKSQFEAVTEAVLAAKETLGERINEVEWKLRQEISDVRVGLGLKIDVVERKFTQKLENVEKNLGEKIDKIGTSVAHHEEEIQHLKKAQNFG